MNNINCVSFRGHGTESTGSLANKEKPNNCPTCGNPISFRGSDDRFEKEGTSAGKVIGGIALLTLVGIAGLGYAHKAEAFKKLGDGWMKKTIGKLEPAGQKCHEWCTKAKTKGTECWNKFKGIFSK